MVDIEITEIRFKDLPEPLQDDDDVEGVLYLDDGVSEAVIPFGREIPEDGRHNKPFCVWSWDGDPKNPTLSPTIAETRYHVKVVKGRVIDAS